MSAKKLRDVLEAWFEKTDYGRLFAGKPATEKQLSRFKEYIAKIDMRLPAAFVEFVQEFGGNIPYNPTRAPCYGFIPSPKGKSINYRPLTPNEMVAHHKEILSTIDSDESHEDYVADAGVAAVRVHAGWLPFAINDAGDYYAVDCSPSKGGKVGQVILVMQESYYRPLISKTFADFVEDLAKAYADKKYSFSETSGDVVKLKRDSFPTYNFDKQEAAFKAVMKRKKKESPKKSRKS